MKYVMLVMLAAVTAMAENNVKREKVGKTEMTLSCKAAAIKAAMKLAWLDARETYKEAKKDDPHPGFYAPTFVGITKDEEDKTGNTWNVEVGEHEECLAGYKAHTKKVGNKCTATAKYLEQDCG